MKPPARPGHPSRSCFGGCGSVRAVVSTVVLHSALLASASRQSLVLTY